MLPLLAHHGLRRLRSLVALGVITGQSGTARGRWGSDDGGRFLAARCHYFPRPPRQGRIRASTTRGGSLYLLHVLKDYVPEGPEVHATRMQVAQKRLAH